MTTQSTPPVPARSCYAIAVTAPRTGALIELELTAAADAAHLAFSRQERRLCGRPEAIGLIDLRTGALMAVAGGQPQGGAGLRPVTTRALRRTAPRRVEQRVKPGSSRLPAEPGLEVGDGPASPEAR